MAAVPTADMETQFRTELWEFCGNATLTAVFLLVAKQHGDPAKTIQQFLATDGFINSAIWLHVYAIFNFCTQREGQWLPYKGL
jgi:hypothetical protein